MLTSSQKPDLSQSEQEYAYSCLLPSWKKQDLFKLGREVYQFQEEAMEDRFYFSGGSVRLFTTEIEQMDIYIFTACSFVEKDKHVVASKKHSERLCHTFVKDTQDPENYLYSSNWERIIDSERAINLLSNKLRSEELLRFFHWARDAGYDSLTGLLFEICLYCLVFDNKLILNVSEYDPLKPREERYVEWKRLEMEKGGLFCSDTATEDYYDEDELKEWRDDDTLSYWYPYCDDFPNIDGIVKLKPSSPDKKSRVAFLHLTVGHHQHRVDDKQLGLLQEIFTTKGFEPPIYVVLCPDLDSCNEIVVQRGSQGVKQKGSCRVFVGYYDESPLEHNRMEHNDDDWQYWYNLSPKERSRLKATTFRKVSDRV